MEKELRRLSKASADHEKALRRAVEKAVADYPNSEEGRNFLEAYWANKIAEYKKSDDFQKEVAQVAFPFMGYGFNCLRQCSKPLCQSFCPREGRSSSKLSLLGEVEAEVRRTPLPPQQQLISQRGGVPGEGKQEAKKDNAPTDPPESPSNDPPASAAVPEGTPSSSGPKDPEDPTCGEKI
ncbi:UNVERIFIED_CONTAM: hypothetical protein Sradi_4018900 [Sesamum radiatum]|uniref:Uncharacterized protein n=1 Tax=Sesamum radiatum TaxID=300843 RepID=A0AAW2PKH6_SESRA